MMPAVDELRRIFLCDEGAARVLRLPAVGAASGVSDAGAGAASTAPDDAPSQAGRLDPSGLPVAREGGLGEAVVAIGAFDGFHIGHRELVAQTVADARARGAASVVVTFDPDPDCVVGPAPAPKLTSASDRLRLLAASGADAVVVVPFTRALAALDHIAFFRLLDRYMRVRAVHVGADFRLGRGGASTVAVMRAWGAERGVDVEGHDLVHADGSAVSATRIRRLLAAGRVEDASAELGRPFAVRGTIASGRGAGTGMGFPTANIRVDPSLQMPADGVYAGLALLDGVVWPAAVNMGLPPTFADRPGAAHLEANLIGFAGDVRGEAISLAFCRFLRPSRVFDDQRELIDTVLGNIADIRAEFGGGGVRIA